MAYGRKQDVRDELTDWWVSAEREEIQRSQDFRVGNEDHVTSAASLSRKRFSGKKIVPE